MHGCSQQGKSGALSPGMEVFRWVNPTLPAWAGLILSIDKVDHCLQGLILQGFSAQTSLRILFPSLHKAYILAKMLYSPTANLAVRAS